MITSLNQITYTKTQLCSAELWNQMTSSETNKKYIEMYRKTGVIDWKQRLPAVNFHGYDPKVLRGLDGSRKQSEMIPTGLFMLDIDHVENPTIYWKALQHKLAENVFDAASIALVHITPSGKGLRIVMKGREGSCIKDDQAWLASLLGVQHDACTKDLSRWSFVPTKSDILYQNSSILFAQPSEATDYNVQATGATDDEANDNLSPQSGGAGGGLFPTHYKGIPYSKIVSTLIQYHGGTPEMGERHARIITLANDLRYITDSNADWLRQIIPNFNKPEHEKRDAVTWCVQHNSLRKTKALSAVLDHLINGTPLKSASETESDEDEEAELTEKQEREQEQLNAMPQLPEKLPRLIELLTSKVMPFQKPAVASMVFPALAAHVSNSCFVGLENKPYELSLMGVLVGKQSVGKGCLDDPIREINYDISVDDEKAREMERAWHESQQNKGANEKGAERPKMPIRLISANTTNAALLLRFFNAERNGEKKGMRCYTKVEEIEKLFSMGITQTGKPGVHTLIKDTWDVAALDSERFGLNSANYTTVLRWNWNASCTPDKVRDFFKKVLNDGTLSRVDFAVLLAPEEDFKFRYGDYDDAFIDALEPYIENLKNFQCEEGKRGRLKPFRLAKLDELEERADEYIKEKKKAMPDDTWVSYAWRTKMIALKKLLVLYIANGGWWEDCFEDFFWWSFNYSMWCKMNLFYAKAREAFGNESIFSEVCTESPLDMVGDTFTRAEMKEAMEKGGFTTNLSNYLSKLKQRKKIEKIEKGVFKKISQSVSQKYNIHAP